MQALLNLADELGLTVIEKRVAHTSGYRASDRHVFLTPGMQRRRARSALAHEIAHHVLEHRPTEFGPVHKRQERHANEWAARLLIPHDRYIEVERLRDGHLLSMAHDLDVAPELLEVHQSMLLRLGPVTYFDPCLGSAAWSHREDVVA